MRFIPGFHFQPVESKLTSEWCSEVIDHYYYNGGLINLLHGKKVDEIDGYATGNYSMEPFRRLFQSERRQSDIANDPNYRKQLDKSSKSAIQWEPVALITSKLNSAISLLQKIPIEVNATCMDALAQKKKKEDLDFLKNKSNMESVLQPLYDTMNLGQVDLGSTQHSSIPFTAMPMDLDVDNEDEFRMFSEMLYNLAPESSFEAVLQMFYEFKKVNQIRLLEIKDQYYYGVSSNRVFGDKNTDLPNVEYVFPGTISTDGSLLPDYSDNLIRVIDMPVTPMELFKYFPDEIRSEEDLDRIVNFKSKKGDSDNGYCACNRISTIIDKNNWATFKMTLKYIEVKSVDKTMVGQRKNSKYKYVTDKAEKKTEEIWGQNTYCFYWLVNTKWFFGIDKLGFAYRSQGCEIFSGFSTNIYKSQDKSAVELCIGENKKAQMADIKLQHAIIMSKPAGSVVDIKYIRNAVDGLKEGLNEYGIKELLEKAVEENIHIIDSTGFENKQNAGNYVPVRDLPGGLKDEIVGYYRVILEADLKINKFLGTNDQLTGQSTNPEGLVGLQKLLINSAINALFYVNAAITDQYQAMFNTVAWYIKDVIERGGAGKKAIINMIGTRKVDIIAGLEDIPLHQIGIKITLGQREEEKARVKMAVQALRDRGVLNAIDEYLILNTANPKDAAWLISVKENKFVKRQEQMQADNRDAQQQAIETQSQAMLQNTQQQQDGKIQQIGAEIQGKERLMQLGAQLNLTKDQVDGLIKRQLQKERLEGQTSKSLKTIAASKGFEAQQPLI